MCSYDSTCDHLPLVDLCPKEATHPQIEAFGISRKVNTDYNYLGPLLPRRVRPPFHWPLCLVQNTRILSPFYLYLTGTKIYSTQVHSCLEMFEPSTERDLIEILIDENLVILSTGSITRNSFESHCRQVFELLSGVQMTFL